MFSVDEVNITNITDLDEVFDFSNGVYIVLIVLNIVIVLTAIVGNGTVIYASKLNHAIKMDKTSLSFLENLAAADILISIVFFVPITLTLITRKWILGSAVCFINAFFTSTPSIVEIHVLTAISVHRIWFIKNPFAREIKQLYITLLIVCLWIIASIPPIVWILLDTFAFYDPYALSCISSVYTDTGMTSVALGASVLLVGIPLLIVIVCNIFLLNTAIRHNKKMGQSLSGIAVLTITVICWTFVISWLPFIIKMILKTFAVGIPAWFYIFQIEMLGLNVTCNPVIYTITNKRFRRFLVSRLFKTGAGRRARFSSSSGQYSVNPAVRQRDSVFVANPTARQRDSVISSSSNWSGLRPNTSGPRNSLISSTISGNQRKSVVTFTSGRKATVIFEMG